MNTEHQSCNNDRIEQFLSDQLGAEQVAAFESHLESCTACRHELDARAADEGWWSYARRYLAESGLSSIAYASRVGSIAGEGTRS